MEININCDLGESSKLHSTENDTLLLNVVNSANIACGYHAGDEKTMAKTIEISKKNSVSIGAHPSFKDRENFGRKRLNLSHVEIKQLITEQINVLSEIVVLLQLLRIARIFRLYFLKLIVFLQNEII